MGRIFVGFIGGVIVTLLLQALVLVSTDQVTSVEFSSEDMGVALMTLQDSHGQQYELPMVVMKYGDMHIAVPADLLMMMQAGASFGQSDLFPDAVPPIINDDLFQQLSPAAETCVESPCFDGS